MKKSEVASAINTAIGDRLKDLGFEQRQKSSWKMCRVLETRIEILETTFADMKGFVPYGLTNASFMLNSAVFIRGLPHPMGASFSGIAGEPINSAGDGHFVLRAAPRRILQGWVERSHWRVGRFLFPVRFAARDVARIVRSEILPWFASFDDLEQVLQDSDRALKAGRFGREPRESVRSADLLLGLLALKLGRWSLALERLQTARQVKNPAHRIDATQPEGLYEYARPLIEAGIARCGQETAPAE